MSSSGTISEDGDGLQALLLTTLSEKARDVRIDVPERFAHFDQLVKLLTNSNQSPETQNQVLETFALIAGNQLDAGKIRDRAFELLQPCFDRVIRRTTSRLAGQLKQDIIDGAKGDIWTKLPLFKGGQFESWCNRVFINWINDIFRRRNADPLTNALSFQISDHAEESKTSSEPTDFDLRVRLESQLDWKEMFSDKDLASIDNWPTLYRLVGLCLRGILWEKVPNETWHKYANEAGLEWPFPPAGFRDDDERGRRQILCSLLAMKRNTLAKTDLRVREYLKQLEYIKGLRR